MTYIPNTESEQQEMLNKIGVSNFEDLLKSIPKEIRLKTKLNLEDGKSEYEIINELTEISKMNISTNETISFLGGGSYDHYVPSIITPLISRSEFITAYTPYQAEVSQGTLQAIYEYQSMICKLTGMDVANASMYDAATAAAEACLLACSHKNRKEVIICEPFNPNYIQVIKTICHGTDIEVINISHNVGTSNLSKLSEIISEKTAAVLVQNPNYFGCIEDLDEIKKIVELKKSLFVVSVDPISLGILATPAESGADIVVGEGQPMGIPINFGGPYLGIFAVKQELIRKMPGRLSGVTVDSTGNRGFVLTLQTREQQIRREKATSNICSNQGLMMLASAIYMSVMGKQGIKEVANLCLQKSHYLAEEIGKTAGFKLKFSKPFFKEFVIETHVKPAVIIEKLDSENIFAGIDISNLCDNSLLIAVTEKRTKAEMDKFISFLKSIKV
jgi:glycine dehydrogenase subunit 1